MTSKRTLWVASVLIALTVLGGAGEKLLAQNFQIQPPPPRGVAAANWISISGNLGFVVQNEARTGDSGSVTGYFMVNRKGDWWRVTSVPAARPLGLE